MSGYSDHPAVRGRADDYLQKPVRSEALALAVREMLDRATASRPTIGAGPFAEPAVAL